jgi:hypothetical protein
MAKAAFNWKQALFSRELDFNLNKKLSQCYIWSTALYSAKTWTLLKVDQKYLESFENGAEEDRVINEEVLRSQRGQSYPTYK